jgi:hypothetical protein
MHAKVGWADDNTIIYTSRVSDSLPWTIYMLNLETHLRTRLISGPVSYTDPDWTSK